MTAAILSGGENRRIPRLKSLLTVEGRTIIERTIDVLGGVFDRVIINTNEPEYFFHFGLPMIGDLKKERGPLTGIFSVLVATGEDSVFFVACDMPFLHEGLLRHMADAYKGSSDVDAVVPVFRGMTEPLVGIYTKNAVAIMEGIFKEEKRSPGELLKRLKVRYIDEETVREIDPSGRSFVNVNTPEDYERIGGVPCLG
ncbi:MAG TPA: molybdenum cofactor guanylyltransferase [Thermodesulfovibrionales bacterium]|nr:molybdenum cofactor guanylyltransferase [Thermodesulfovibrionales bacterium]